MDKGFLDVEVIVENFDGSPNVIQGIVCPSFTEPIFNYCEAVVIGLPGQARLRTEVIVDGSD